MEPIIGLCGKTGAGKDEATKALKDLFGGTGFKHSDRLRHRLRDNGVPEVQENMSRLFEANALVLGYAWLAREVHSAILAYLNLVRLDVSPEAETPGPVVVNGIRNVAEVELYRRQFGAAFRLVALHAPQEVRYERVRNRGERPTERNMSWDAFLAIESLEAHTGEAAVMAMADIEIQNVGTLAEFHQAVARIVRA